MKKLFLITGLIIATNISAATVIGLLQGQNDLVLKSKSQGELKKIYFKEGEKVKAGDIIAVLDDKKETLEKKLAENDFKTAQEDYLKSKKLEKYISQDELIKKKDNYLRKETTLKLRKVNLDAKKIISPIDASIARRMIKVGESISPGQEVFELVDMDNLIIDLNIDAQKSKNLKVGNNLDFTTEFHPNKNFQAKIKYIGQSLDKSSGTISVKLTLKNKKIKGTYELKPGTMIKVKISP
jgi:membrane fusion protein (multidrug efflux system)